MSGPRARARQIAETVAALPARSVGPMRAIRRAASAELKRAAPEEVRHVACGLIHDHGLRWMGYELLAAHKGAFTGLTAADIEALADGLDSWGAVDAYGVILAGPAWRAGLVEDELVAAWADSSDRWRRRLALVAAVPVARAGDARRALSICERLVADRDDMVVKALSWTLRELAKADPVAARTFLAAHDSELAARVRREVRHKLETGLKAPRRRRG